MNSIPERIKELLRRYPFKQVVHVTHILGEEERINEVMFGALMIPIDSGNIVLIKHTYALPGIGENDWTIPGGKSEKDESLEETAIRETFEETGLTCDVIDLFKVFHLIHMNGEEITSEWYAPVFVGRTHDESKDYSTREISEIGRFKELPPNFAGSLNEHYTDFDKYYKKRFR